MNAGEIRAFSPLPPTRSAGPTPATATREKDPADHFQPGEVAGKAAPAPARQALLNVSMRLPASLVAGLPGMVLALVPEHEVVGGRWQPTPQSQVLTPSVLHAQVFETPPEGHQIAMLAVPFPDENLAGLSPGATGGFFLHDPSHARPGLDLATASQGKTGDAVLTASLVVPPDMALEELETKTVALLPRQELAGNPFTPAPAPEVERCMHYPAPANGVQYVQLVVQAPVQSLEQHPEKLVDLFFSPLPDWVTGTLEKQGVSLEQARERLSRPARPEELADPAQRRLMAGANLLLAGMQHQTDVQTHGYETVEVLRASLARGGPAELPEVDAAEGQRMIQTATYQVEPEQVFQAFERAGARGEKTELAGIQLLAQQLGGSPTPEMELLNQAMAHHAQVCQQAGKPAEFTLGALKASSDALLGSSKLIMALGGLAATAITTGLAGAALATGQTWLMAGIPVLAGSPAKRAVDAYRMRDQEKQINQLLGQALQAAGDDRSLVAFVEKRLRTGS